MADDIAPPGFTSVLLFDDPTPNGIIMARITQRTMQLASRYAPLEGQAAEDFLDLVILIARKMASVWKHYDAYVQEEDRLIRKVADDPKHLEYSQVLFLEFDEFTVQIKSTLDHLVKVLRPFVGRSWTLGSFGEKGDKVLKALRNLPKQYSSRVRFMEDILFTEVNKQWLTAVIDSRDRVNHYQNGGLNYRNFAVVRQPDGKVEVPMWSDEMKLRDAMQKIWENFFRYVESFLVLSLAMKMDEKWALLRNEVPSDSRQPTWTVVARAYALEMLQRRGEHIPPHLQNL